MTSRMSAALAVLASTAAFVGISYYCLHNQNIHKLSRRRDKTNRAVQPRCYSLDAPSSLSALKALVSQETQVDTYPLAADIQKKVPIYDCTGFDLSNDNDAIRIDALQDEMYHCLTQGPGVFVLKHFFAPSQAHVIDRANVALDAIIAREKANQTSPGDHFAPASANSRVWNSFSKHCLEDPQSFFDYFSNPWFQIICEAYLGPAYRLTTQLNIVRPGGKPQVSHRDYHLGFQTREQAVKWPKSMHVASALLTLQGAVAHSDMPVESGPTRLLPYTQTLPDGYLAYRRPEFDEYFLQNYVSLPLAKGDALVFSPALFHAAGENQTTNVHRSANLFQVSSAFGKPMETIDSTPLVERSWDVLRNHYAANGLDAQTRAFAKAVGEGYPFPTNLDQRPPAPGGMAPDSEQDVILDALKDGLGTEEVVARLVDMQRKSRA